MPINRAGGHTRARLLRADGPSAGEDSGLGTRAADPAAQVPRPTVVPAGLPS